MISGDDVDIAKDLVARLARAEQERDEAQRRYEDQCAATTARIGTITALRRERDAALAQVAALRELLEWAQDDTRKIGVADSGWPEAWGREGTRMEQSVRLLSDTAAAAQAFVERIRAEEREACAKALDDPALLEVLADAEHQRWASWMRYQQTAPPETRADWPRKVALVYWGMTEAEKESDRVEARKTLAIILNRIRARAQGVEAVRDAE